MRSLLVFLVSLSISLLAFQLERIDSPSVATLSEDGRFLAVGTSDGKIWVFDLEKMVLLRKFKVSSEVSALTFTGGGKYVVSGERDGTFDVLNVETGGVIQSVKVNPSPVIKVFSLKNGRYIAVARYDGRLEIWDSAGWWKFVDINSALNDPNDVEITDRYAVVAKGRIVKVWSLVNSKLINTIPLDFEVSDIEVTLGGRTLVVSGTDSKGSTKILAMSLLTGMDVEDLSVLPQIGKGIDAMRVSPDGVILVGMCTDGRIRVWNLNTFELVDSFTVGNPDGVTFTGDGMTLATFRSDWKIDVWKIKGNWIGKVVEDFHGDVSDIDYVPGLNGILVSGYKLLAIYDVNGEKIFKVKARGYITSADLDLKNGKIVTGSIDGKVKLWDTKGNFITIVGESDSRILDVVFSKDGKIFSISKFGRLSVWDVDGGYEIGREDLDYDITSAKFSIGGNYLIIGTLEGGLVLLDTSKKSEVWSVKAFENPTSAVRIFKDYVIAGDSQGNIQLRRLDGGDLILSVKGKLKEVSAVSLDEKGSVIVSADKRGNVEVWDMKGRLVDRFEMDGAVLDIEIVKGDYFMGGWSGRLIKWMKTNLANSLILIPGRDYMISNSRGECVISEGFEDKAKYLYHITDELKTCEIRH